MPDSHLVTTAEREVPGQQKQSNWICSDHSMFTRGTFLNRTGTAPVRRVNVFTRDRLGLVGRISGGDNPSDQALFHVKCTDDLGIGVKLHA